MIISDWTDALVWLAAGVTSAALLERDTARVIVGIAAAPNAARTAAIMAAAASQTTVKEVSAKSTIHATSCVTAYTAGTAIGMLRGG